MVAHSPDIASLADVRARARFERFILATRSFALSRTGVIEDDGDLACLESGQLDLKVEIDQFLQLDRRDSSLFQPAFSASLLSAKMYAFFSAGERCDSRSAGTLLYQSQELRPQPRPGRGQQRIRTPFFVDQYWVIEAKALDALGDLPDLLL